MTTRTIKLIAFCALLVHGIGHFQGVASGLGLKINKYEASQSWLLNGLSSRASKVICLVLFLITGILGIMAALSFRGILLQAALWQSLATITAILSTVCLVVFPHGFAMFFNKIGAIGVNLLIYYSIVFGQHWPAVLFED